MHVSSRRASNHLYERGYEQIEKRRQRQWPSQGCRPHKSAALLCTNNHKRKRFCSVCYCAYLFGEEPPTTFMREDTNRSRTSASDIDPHKTVALAKLLLCCAAAITSVSAHCSVSFTTSTPFVLAQKIASQLNHNNFMKSTLPNRLPTQVLTSKSTQNGGAATNRPGQIHHAHFVGNVLRRDYRDARPVAFRVRLLCPSDEERLSISR